MQMLMPTIIHFLLPSILYQILRLFAIFILFPASPALHLVRQAIITSSGQKPEARDVMGSKIQANGRTSTFIKRCTLTRSRADGVLCISNTTIREMIQGTGLPVPINIG